VKIFRPLKILSLALMVGLGCDKPHEPCQKTLEILPLPAIFDVSKNDVNLGTVTVDKNGTLKLIRSSEADSNAVAELERVVDRLSKSKVVNFTYSERAKDTHYSCGGQIAQETPQFADGVRWSLYSSYYDVKTRK
jgi:hypothetical protein